MRGDAARRGFDKSPHAEIRRVPLTFLFPPRDSVFLAVQSCPRRRRDPA